MPIGEEKALEVSVPVDAILFNSLTVLLDFDPFAEGESIEYEYAEGWPDVLRSVTDAISMITGVTATTFARSDQAMLLAWLNREDEARRVLAAQPTVIDLESSEYEETTP